MDFNKEYLSLANKIIKGNNTFGNNVRPKYADGTPAHTYYLNNFTQSWDVSEGILPITSLRNENPILGIKEYLWIFQKQTSNLEVLKKMGVNYWDDWNIGDGTIGNRYGHTVRNYQQIDKLIQGLKENPLHRRHILDLYQFADLNSSKGLYPCLFLHVFNVRDEYLDLMSVQRSSDYLVSSGLNKAQSIALLMMIAKSIGKKAGMFTYCVGNLHIYDRHLDNLKILNERYVENLPSPKLIFSPKSDDFYSFTINDFRIENYNPIKPNLKFEVAI